MSKPISEFKKILVPLDFSKNSVMLLQKAGQIANKLGAELEIIHVVESFTPYMGFAVPHIPLDSLTHDLEIYAEKKITELSDENLPAETAYHTKVISGQDATETIIKHAQESGCDLIIIASQGFKGLPKFLFGSVAERVCKQASCPVMTIKPE